MTIEKLNVDYEGISLIISELRKLYEIGDEQTRRQVDFLIGKLLIGPYLFINDDKK